MHFLLLLLLFAGSSRAADLPDCSSPQDAADTLLALLQPDDWQPEAAATCLNLKGKAAERGPKLAVQLKQVLDARGLYVPVGELSSDPAWMPESGKTVVLVDTLPIVYLERVDDQWLWSADTMRATPSLHAETFSGIGAWVKTALPPQLAGAALGAVNLWQLVLFGLLLLVAVLAALFVNFLLTGRVQALVDRLSIQLDTKVLARTRAPMRMLALGVVFLWGIPELQLGVRSSQVLLLMARVVVSASVVGILFRWIDVATEVFAKRAEATETRMDDQLIPLASKGAKIVAASLGLLFVLQNMGVDVGSLVAGLGIGGLAIALGAQDLLKNLFGSVTIFMDRPFHVGDWVIVNGDIEGTVEEVGFRSTRIRTFASSLISVPNGVVANSKVDNMGHRKLRRVKTVLGLTYDTHPDALQAYVEGLRAILAAHPSVFKGSYEVHFRDFGASSLDILVYFFLDVPDWHAELISRSQVFLEFMRLAEELNVSFAFPSTSVYLESTPERPLPRRAPPENMGERVDAFGPGGRMSRPGGPTISSGWTASTASERGSES